MKVQEVLLRAMAKKITWWQAAEIIGISDRSMRRWHRVVGKVGRTLRWPEQLNPVPVGPCVAIQEFVEI